VSALLPRLSKICPIGSRRLLHTVSSFRCGAAGDLRCGDGGWPFTAVSGECGGVGRQDSGLVVWTVPGSREKEHGYKS